MSVYNKIGGGVNKVLIDNKPPADRLNLTEIDAMYLEKVDCLDNVVEQVKINDEYYIIGKDRINFKLIKGNYQKGWTEIKKMNDLNHSKSLTGFKMLLEKNEIYLFSSDSQTIYIDKYNIYSNTWTFINKINKTRSTPDWSSIFLYNGEKYLMRAEPSGIYTNKYIYKSKDFKEITDITSNVKITTTTSFYDIKDPLPFNGKIYFLGMQTTNVEKISSFDGINLKDEFDFPTEIVKGYKEYYKDLLNTIDKDTIFILGRCINEKESYKVEQSIALYKLYKLTISGLKFIKNIFIPCGKELGLIAPFEYENNIIRTFFGNKGETRERITMGKVYKKIEEG